MIEIREMKLEDLQKIKDFSEFDDFWNFDILKQDFFTSGTTYYILLQNDEIVGLLGINQIMDIVEIRNIAVKKIYRGKGFGKNLLTYFLKEVQKNDTIQKIELEVNEKNEIAIQLYKKQGFKEVGRRKKYYNNQDDAILMNFEK